MDSGATPTGVHPRPSMTLSRITAERKRTATMHAVKEGSHLGCEQERAASQKRFERKRRGKCGKKSSETRGVRMKRSFPPRFYRERRDILTLSVPSKKGAFMHDRARNERRRAYGSRENGVETSSRPVGGFYRGVAWRDVDAITIGPKSKNARLHWKNAIPASIAV